MRVVRALLNSTRSGLQGIGTAPIFGSVPNEHVALDSRFHARTLHSHDSPRIYRRRQQKGKLEYLHFTASDGSNIEKWWSVNISTLGEDFRALFGDWGPGILERLRNGQTVKLPRPLQLKEALTIGGSRNGRHAR